MSRTKLRIEIKKFFITCFILEFGHDIFILEKQ